MKIELLKILDERGADFLLLENCDPVAFLHNENTQLACMTGFLGSAGEGILRADGKTFLLVDPRYHLQAEKHATKEVELIKIQMGESFLDALERLVPKGTKVLVSKCISLNRFKKIKKKFKNIETVDFETYKKAGAKSSTPLVQIPLEISGISAKEKISKIATIVAKKGAEAYFISGVEDIAWLTNLRGRDFQYSSTFRAKMIVRADGVAILFTDHKVPEGITVAPFGEYKKHLGNLRGTVLYYPPHTTLRDFELMNLTGVPVNLRQNPVAKMMSIKNGAEITHLKSCFARTDTALERFKLQIKEGLTERELREIIERELLKEANALSFSTILGVGKNGASIHYNGFDDSVRLKHGDLVLLDCGAYYEGGYATDITRVFVCGEPSVAQKRVYTLVLQAFMRSYHSDTNNPAELDKIAREFLKKHAPKNFSFPHALGHGVGINVHQAPPTLAPKNKGRLKEGMVFSIEPGLYQDNAFGVRFENCVCVDKNGKKQTLSHFEFEKKLVDEKMLSKKEQNWLKSF